MWGNNLALHFWNEFWDNLDSSLQEKFSSVELQTLFAFLDCESFWFSSIFIPLPCVESYDRREKEGGKDNQEYGIAFIRKTSNKPVFEKERTEGNIMNAV